MRGWKALLAIAILGGSGAVMTSPIPARAYAFVERFEKTSRTGEKVGFWERVVYSLIEANDRGADCRAPGLLRS